MNNELVLNIDVKNIPGIAASDHHHDHIGRLLEILESLKRPVDGYHTLTFSKTAVRP